MKSIYQQMIEAEVPVSGYQSDLYVPVNDTTTEILSHYEFRTNVTTFRNNIDGKMWYDIPFASDPYWEKKVANRG
jgi:hypothetical protein